MFIGRGRRRSGGLTGARNRSTFVLMEVETLGWRGPQLEVHMRCSNGYRLEETRSNAASASIASSWTLSAGLHRGGPNFPLGRLEGRLMCPACGNRRVVVVFEPPSNAQVGG